ncbi:hypothetical protein AB0C12_29300 [Actinoplanes sp. NPDC048967]|uniref:hypothetical protein n=1 Tax=Actinoplanes sp. NPDC048967 TaxID=3155269 RepID=UPI003401B5D3
MALVTAPVRPAGGVVAGGGVVPPPVPGQVKVARAPTARLRSCHRSESAKVLADSVPEHSVKKTSLAGWALCTTDWAPGSPV